MFTCQARHNTIQAEQSHGRSHAGQTGADETNVEFDNRPYDDLLDIVRGIGRRQRDPDQDRQPDDGDDGHEAAQGEHARDSQTLGGRGVERVDVRQG